MPEEPMLFFFQSFSSSDVILLMMCSEYGEEGCGWFAFAPRVTLVRTLRFPTWRQQGGTAVLGGGAGIFFILHIHLWRIFYSRSLMKNFLCSRHIPHMRIYSLPLDTLISLGGFGGHASFSLLDNLQLEGHHVQKGSSILLRRKRKKMQLVPLSFLDNFL